MYLREGTAEDLPRLLELIYELAIYENAENQVSNTVERMKQDGFGPSAVFGFFVVEIDGVLVGAAVYYWRYSTWKGKRIYLEDLIVTDTYRGQGIGQLLFDQVIAHGKAEGASGMMWQVLDWNESAINFYKKYQASFDEEWLNCHIDFQ
ncbi:GNAT family N-acetyltransferase [Reichenbachiella carrageenanivorans]|uniref:GNAT family N-acetyltransferase n=1 Tax=Reichenbachiella carrageenanivorans TaxID=2979869 RepID=A0ABY6D2A1_9BACT|nr:GNAT family N-acetyltransferase [Reichenbachiella carrageenanivorans]UXX80271.1 GNAT family N-acetyltransferase [Reichenbachiella carrageenanivorans]